MRYGVLSESYAFYDFEIPAYQLGGSKIVCVLGALYGTWESTIFKTLSSQRYEKSLRSFRLAASASTRSLNRNLDRLA